MAIFIAAAVVTKRRSYGRAAFTALVDVTDVVGVPFVRSTGGSDRSRVG
ncbi:hypothetical protein [Halorubrum sp. N11]